MIARLLCSVIGHLMVIDSQQELDAVAKNETTIYWIDLNDFDTEGNWVVSLTGEKGYTNWRNSNENSGSTNENCALILSKRMVDVRCSRLERPICETFQAISFMGGNPGG